MSSVGEKQNIISLLERSIESFSFTYITFRARLVIQESARRLMLSCLKKSRLRRLLITIATLIVMGVIIYYLIIPKPIFVLENPWIIILVLMTLEYILAILLSFLLFSSPIKFPFEYHIFIHKPQKLQDSLIIVTRYKPKGQEMRIIPLENLRTIILDETVEVKICKNKIKTAEIKLLGKNNKVLGAVGRYASLADLKNTIRELWRELFPL